MQTLSILRGGYCGSLTVCRGLVLGIAIVGLVSARLAPNSFRVVSCSSAAHAKTAHNHQQCLDQQDAKYSIATCSVLLKLPVFVNGRSLPGSDSIIEVLSPGPVLGRAPPPTHLS
jgi:hypothetical protein